MFAFPADAPVESTTRFPSTHQPTKVYPLEVLFQRSCVVTTDPGAAHLTESSIKPRGEL